MLGLEVVTTMNVIKVMAVIHARQPRLEMAIVDARLGNADGLEFLTFLSHHDPRIRECSCLGNSARLSSHSRSRPSARSAS
jgi:hypothetical protein